MLDELTGDGALKASAFADEPTAMRELIPQVQQRSGKDFLVGLDRDNCPTECQKMSFRGGACIRRDNESPNMRL